jgi:hypothetical protein
MKVSYHNNGGTLQTYDRLEILCHEVGQKMRVWRLGVGLQEVTSKTPQADVVKSPCGDR